MLDTGMQEAYFYLRRATQDVEVRMSEPPGLCRASSLG
jgi:hypothetical protein